MKQRSLKLLMAVILIMQTISFTSVFASAESNAATFVDFSGTKYFDQNLQVTDGVAGNAIVYGQYGKAHDDASLRMYTTGGDNSENQIVRYNPNLTIASGEYVHISFEYLREDLHSGLRVDMTFKSDGSTMFDRYILDHPVNSSDFVNLVRLFNSTKRDVEVKVKDNYGSWCKVDAYFSYSTGNATIFLNGVKYEKDLSTSVDWAGSGKTYSGMNYLDRVRFFHLSDKITDTTPSAVQLDNVLIEKVTSIPTELPYKKYGEKLDFDDHTSLTQHGEGYGLYNTTYWNGSSNVVVTRYNGYGNGPAVNLGQPYGNMSIVNGVFGKPDWDRSLHRVIPDAAAITHTMTWYKPSITDLAVGDIAHLTFNVANSAADVDFVTYSEKSVFGDNSTVERTEFFRMTASDKKVRVFQKNTDVTWQPNTWYKVDMIFKVTADGTYVDCYLNGSLISEENKWNEGKALKNINQVWFTHDLGSDYYLDDIAYNRISLDSINSISNGFTLTDTDDTYIDNDKKIIAISSDASIADFVNLLPEKKNVTVYNKNGIINYTGTLNSDSTVKVSTGFGAGTYYNVGYKTDKLAIGDIIYDSAAQQLKSQAEVGFTIREDFNEATTPVQTTGTVIIALYDGDELVGCIPQPYTGLAEDAAKEVILEEVESVAGKTIKVFIFNSETDITPLVVNKEKTFN